MRLDILLKKSEKFLTDNSPVILTAVGVTGVALTAYLTAKATIKSVEDLRIARIDRDEAQLKDVPLGEGILLPKYPEITGVDAVKVVWKNYLPALGVAAVTCSAIVCANRIGTKRTAAMASALTLAERAHEEFRGKAEARLGPKKTREVVEEIAQEQVNRQPVGGQEVVMTGGGDSLCYDSYTGRYFYSSVQAIQQAEIDVNRQILHHDYASLTDFYCQLGLSRTDVSDNLGWNSDQLIELEPIITTVSDDQRPCFVVKFRNPPSQNYFRRR